MALIVNELIKKSNWIITIIFYQEYQDHGVRKRKARVSYQEVGLETRILEHKANQSKPFTGKPWDQKWPETNRSKVKSSPTKPNHSKS